MARLMRGQLPNASERHFVGLLELVFVTAEWIEQPLRDQKHLADSECVEVHMAIDDLAGARIGNGNAIGPASRCPRNPLDDVIANIHGVDTLRQQLHLKCVVVSGRGESLVPPGCAFDDGGAYGLWYGAIHVINDGCYRFAHYG